MKKLLSLFLAAVIICAVPCFGVLAASVSTEYESDDMLQALPTSGVTEMTGLPDINSKATVLMEQYSGEVIYKDNADEHLPIASVTKIMSLILVMEAIENGQLTLDTGVTASAHAASMGGSQIWLKEGEVMTVDELLRATCVASANDATVALAEAVAGSEEGFVDKMNGKAKALNMKNTSFKNASGLDEDDHYSSALDVALMSRELLKHDLIKKYTCVWMDALRDGQSQLVNTNKLIRYYEGCTGLKTGTTSKAGSCLSASAQKGGLSLICVVLGCPSSKERFAAASKMLDYGFCNYTYEQIEIEKELLSDVAVTKSVNNTVKVAVASNDKLLLKRGAKAKVEKKVNLPQSVEAPVSAGDILGTVDFYLDGKKIGSAEICAAEDAKRLDFLTALSLLYKNLLLN